MNESRTEEAKWTKSQWRSHMRQLRTYLSQEDHGRKSQKVQEHALSSGAFQEAGSIALYAASSVEVGLKEVTEHAWDLGKRVSFPLAHPETRTLTFHETRNWNDLVPGLAGILEPVEGLPAVKDADVDLYFVPGLAFDGKGFRLGYGAGYYDRWFERARRGTPRIGVAFAFQVVVRLPSDPFDVPMTHLLTDEGIVACQMER